MRNFTYPEARKDDVVEDYHGTPVADPYRWLEDPNSEETIAWVTAENQLTADFLSEIPARAVIHKRLTSAYDYPKMGAPAKHGKHYIFTKQDGLQNQPTYYKQTALDATPETLLDVNALSDDGTVAVVSTHFTKDGSRMAYMVSASGSDWREIHVRDVETGEALDDVVQWVKFTSMAWLPDGSGYYYSRFPEPGDDEQEMLVNNTVYLHRLSTDQAEDQVIYANPETPQAMHSPRMSDDGQYLILDIYGEAMLSNRVYYRRLDDDGAFVRLLDELDSRYDFLGNDGSVFYFFTIKDAPFGKVIAIDTQNPAPEQWRDIIPEAENTLIDVNIVNNHFVAVYMHHASHRIKVFSMTGNFQHDIDLPDLGTISDIERNREHHELFFSFQSYLHPSSTLRYDFTTNQLTTLHAPKVDTSVYETRQVFFESKDGTRVPMFITARKDLDLNGDNPTLVYGYGGFNAGHTPMFEPWLISWLEMGGVYCDVNLRGGDEYGEAWHKAGMLENKQNVFDDFIAASEWLIAHDYTRTERLAIYGRSNGGLLVSACMMQRPDLFGSVICGVPVTDMLRFHKFTVGRYWTYEYGNAEENPDHFKFMHAYSPLHNVKEGVTYPPILITSADHDDRVVPLHSKKMTATIQAADSGLNPILLRLDTKSGHGLGKPIAKWIEEWADIQAFLVRTLKMDV